MSYKMTPEALVDIKELWGVPLKEDEVAGLKGKYIVTVGDMVTHTFLKNGVRPHIMYFDLMTERKPYEVLDEELKDVVANRHLVKNAAGEISTDLIRESERAFKKVKKSKWTRYAIQVLGEEDLAALPAIILSEDDWLIVYGEPGVGMRIIKSDLKIRKKVVETLMKMKEV